MNGNKVIIIFIGFCIGFSFLFSPISHAFYDAELGCNYTNASIQCDIIDPSQNITDLISIWLMNENAGSVAYDSEDSNDATLLGTSNFVDGYLYNAIEFDGNSDSLEINDNSNLEPSDEISLSCWVYAHDLDAIVYQEIFRKEDGSNRILFSFQDSGTILSFGINTGGYSELDVGINKLNYENQWVHLVATYDGVNKRIYRNGIQIGIQPKSGLTTGGSAKAYIGSNGGSSEYFDGLIDDFRFYERGLTSEEVNILYQSYTSNISVYVNYTQITDVDSIVITGNIDFSNNDENTVLAYYNFQTSNFGFYTVTSGEIDETISLQYFNSTTIILCFQHTSESAYLQEIHLIITIFYLCENPSILYNSFIFLFSLFFVFLFVAFKTNLKLTSNILFFMLIFLSSMLLMLNFTSVYYIYIDIGIILLATIIYFEIVFKERE